MRTPIVLSCGLFLLAGCPSQTTQIQRLSPLSETSKPPADCQIISVIKDSPAHKAGVLSGETLRSVNGQVPENASVLPDIISAAQQEADIEIVDPAGQSRHIKVQLNNGRPRLGTVCDLTGWEKPGVTAAGNESITVFKGPYAMTASGIIDKGIIFIRVRLSNNTDQGIQFGPGNFSAFDKSGKALAILSPKDVMCFLYGDKGAHLLSLKKKRKETMDGHELLPDVVSVPEEHCDTGVVGKLATSDPQYAEANAQYLATESLSPATYQMGTVADGLIFLQETSQLPVTLKAAVQGNSLFAKLGQPQASLKEVKPSELIKFFETQKKGAPLRLTLKKGKVFVGKFSSYDPLDERVWFDTPSGGMLNTTSYSVSNIRFVEPLDQIPSKTAPSSNDLN